jgi:hypothetical protein
MRTRSACSRVAVPRIRCPPTSTRRRPQVGGHVAGAGVDDHGGAQVDAAALVHRRGLGGLPDVQRLLTQDSPVQGEHRRPRIDAEVVGQRRLQPLVCGLLELTRGGRLDACGPVRDETADVAVGVGDRQPVARGALASTVFGSSPAPATSLRRLEPYECKLALGSGGGNSSQAALTSESLLTGRLRPLTSIASTARCLGVPNGSGAPSTLVCDDPRTPKSRIITADCAACSGCVV